MLFYSNLITGTNADASVSAERDGSDRREAQKRTGENAIAQCIDTMSQIFGESLDTDGSIQPTERGRAQKPA